MLQKFSAAAFLALVLLPGQAAIGQETRIFTDDAGRQVEIPAAPARIASLHDLFFTIPLIELGVSPAASHGRVGDAGAPYLRSAKILTGQDFDTTDITFLGGGGSIDPETISAVGPDLIIASSNQDPEDYAAIAPTILVDIYSVDKFDIYERLAVLTGTQANLERLKARYAQQITQIRAAIPTADVSINVIAASEGGVISFQRYTSIGKVLKDAGFAWPDALDATPEGELGRFSAEALPEMDADILFLSYRPELGETPADAYAQLEAVVPGFCSFLSACREGRMLALPRDETLATSYNALGMLTYSLLTAVTASPQVWPETSAQ